MKLNKLFEMAKNEDIMDRMLSRGVSNASVANSAKLNKKKKSFFHSVKETTVNKKRKWVSINDVATQSGQASWKVLAQMKEYQKASFRTRRLAFEVIKGVPHISLYKYR